jgi:hypothetical protein
VRTSEGAIAVANVREVTATNGRCEAFGKPE